MTNPIDIGSTQRATAAEQRPRYNPFTGEPIGDEPVVNGSVGEQMKKSAEPLPIPPQPHNPYAPTGWSRLHRKEFDVTLPSGQLCRLMRLEREDLIRLNLMSYLDTFTPLLMDKSISKEERDKRIRESVANDSNAMSTMFMAIDEVVMAASVRPKITNDEAKADYGSPADWTNPDFIATAYINDISLDDRFTMFAEAFGRSMDDLKSFLEQEGGVAGVASESSVQQNS